MPEEIRAEGSRLPDQYWHPPAPKFFGKITEISLRKTSFQDELQDRIVVEMEDLSGTREGPRLAFFGPSNRKNSKWGRWLTALRELGVEPDRTGEVIGLCFQFELQDWEFGGDFVATDVPVPVRLLPDEESAREEARQEARERGLEVPSEQPEEAPTEGQESGEEVWFRDLVIDGLDGHTYEDFLETVTSDPDVASNPELLSRLADPDRRYVAELIEEGHLEKDEDGVYHSLREEEQPY